MTVLITGATGSVGKSLTSLLLQNDITVHYLTTNKLKIKTENNYRGFYWNPNTSEIDEACLINVKAIIHLAGASIAKKWTTAYKQEIVESRILSTNLLYRTLKNTNNQVKQFISASAIGIYPDSENSFYNEDFTYFDNSFLSSVVLQWENAVQNIERLDILITKIRIGLVLANNGGVLEQLLKPAKLGFAAPFGSGKQWQSWIHIEDLCAIFLHVLNHNLKGVFNGVAPNPVSNEELNKTLAKTLKKPYFMPSIPKIVMKIVLGEMHTLLFESQKVSSKKIVDTGFEFQYKTLHSAFENLIKKQN